MNITCSPFFSGRCRFRTINKQSVLMSVLSVSIKTVSFRKRYEPYSVDINILCHILLINNLSGYMYSLHARVIYTIYRALSYLLLRRIQNTPHCFLEHTQNSTHQRTYSENSITSDFKIVLRVWARVWKKLHNFGASSSDVNKLSRLISVNHSIVSGTFFHLPLNKVSAWNRVSHHSDFSLIDSCCINPIELLFSI